MSMTVFQTVLTALGLSVLLTRFTPSIAPFESSWLNFVLLESVLLSVKFIWQTFIYPFYFSPLRNLPRPKGGSLINGQFWLIRELPSGGPQKQWIREVPNDGLITYRHIFNRERVLLASPKALAEVLVTKSYEFVKPAELRQSVARLLGNGVLLAEGNEHKRQRKALTPAFSYRHIKDLYPTFWTKACQCISAMSAVVSSPAEEGDDPSIINAQNWASRVTLDIIGLAGMGHDFNSVADPNTKLNKCYRELFSTQRATVILFFLSTMLPQAVLERLPLQRNLKIFQARNLIRGVCLNLIAEKRAKLEKGVAETDILSVAIESGGFTKDEDLVNQLMTFLAAGHETTASAMAWACYHLCGHPEVQSRLRKEIRENLPSPDSGKSVTAADFDKLPYLSAVCNEVLRLYPSVPLTIRVTEGNNSTILGNPIPKGSAIIVCPWAINTDPSLWGEDSDEFNPDRWMAPGQANSGGATSNYAFLGFLHGPRSCIGQQFAKAEFLVLLASWVGRMEMSFGVDDYVLEVEAGITNKPKGGLKVRMKEVKGW